MPLLFLLGEDSYLPYVSSIIFLFVFLFSILVFLFSILVFGFTGRAAGCAA